MPAAAWKALQKDAQLFPTALIKPGCQLSVCVYVASQLRLLWGKSYAVNTAKEEQGIAWRVPNKGRGLKALEEVGLVLVSGFAVLGLGLCGQERRAASSPPETCRSMEMSDLLYRKQQLSLEMQQDD